MEFIATAQRGGGGGKADEGVGRRTGGPALQGGDEGEAGPGTMHVYARLDRGRHGERESSSSLLKGRAHRDRAVIERDVVPAEESHLVAGMKLDKRERATRSRS